MSLCRTIALTTTKNQILFILRGRTVCSLSSSKFSRKRLMILTEARRSFILISCPIWLLIFSSDAQCFCHIPLLRTLNWILAEVISTYFFNNQNEKKPIRTLLKEMKSNTHSSGNMTHRRQF